MSYQRTLASEIQRNQSHARTPELLNKNNNTNANSNLHIDVTTKVNQHCELSRPDRNITQPDQQQTSQMEMCETHIVNKHKLRLYATPADDGIATPAARVAESMARVRVVRWAWAVLAGLCALATCQVQQQCPARAEIAPCSCQVKKNGLDILCEFTDQQHIDNAMSVLKGKSLVIFYLKLRHNNLKKLPGFVFFGLDIRHLTIHNSSLSVVEEASLSSIGKMLTQLDVSQNSLTSVPSAAYKNLHHLLILNMNHNNINSIPNRAFQGLDTLEILTLYENKISTVEPEAFVGLEKRLKRLNLGGNELTSVPQKALSILDTLKKLEMQENQISRIQEGDFEGMKNLDSLGLAHNKLKEVPARAFSHLSQLNSLELDGNNIAAIDPLAFAGLEENLQYLRLGDNNIHTIPTPALRGLHRLRHLDLRANNISFIAEDAFTGYGDSITFLNLQKNDIKALPALGFENLNSLETLNLQNNKIMHIPEEVMEPVVDTLRVVDVMDNPLVCDCELQWYKNWLRNLRDKDDEMMQKKRTVCIMPQEHREYYLQNLPLEKMNCAVKAYDLSPSRGSSKLFSPAAFCFWLYTVKCAL